MIKIKEAIIVEGRYDVNTVKQIVDTVVLETGGFRIFKDAERLNLLRQIADKRGIIILTDSDGAGFVIRNHLKGCIDTTKIKQAYIPDIAGKERRKRHSSKEGKLGVEGMKPDTIIDALHRAGATFEDAKEAPNHTPVTKAEIYELGLTGKSNSAALRQQILQQLKLPAHLSTNALIDVINALGMTKNDLNDLLLHP